MAIQLYFDEGTSYALYHFSVEWRQASLKSKIVFLLKVILLLPLLIIWLFFGLSLFLTDVFDFISNKLCKLIVWWKEF